MPSFIIKKKKNFIFQKHSQKEKKGKKIIEKKQIFRINGEKSKTTGVKFIYFFQITFLKTNMLRKITKGKIFFISKTWKPFLDLKWKYNSFQKKQLKHFILISFQKKKFFFCTKKKGKSAKFLDRKIKNQKKFIFHLNRRRNSPKSEKKNFLFLRKIINYFENKRIKNTHVKTINDILLKNKIFF